MKHQDGKISESRSPKGETKIEDQKQDVKTQGSTTGHLTETARKDGKSYSVSLAGHTNICETNAQDWGNELKQPRIE
ncbi:hypothetical protein JTE90_024915 [Oedothorax gibbosus]|uniref:Uncharacterized protein n=1 Tax=Oedothorax gibbosus TaxID=931172 RepID=A0AAV6TK00_9ARAC|nr:hypothetical protein JTE90_024915 [Oedothorax gibbosus]